MARRALVSTALITDAQLIIADEPTPGMSLEQALEALKMLKDKGALPKDWRFEMIGDGPERQKCEAYIKANGFDFVEMRGYEANPQPFFARAKIFLFPSAREGFGNVLFEAQANGCVPVAFSSYSSVFDIVEHGKNGLFHLENLLK